MNMELKPHLSIMFDGQCEAAFRFYERCLSGTISFMLTWGDSPAAAEAPPDWAGKVYHATLKVGDFVKPGLSTVMLRANRTAGTLGALRYVL